MLCVAVLGAAGCSTCHLTAKGAGADAQVDFTANAIGHAYCTRTADGGVRNEGGAISNNLSELLSTLITAAGAAYAGGVIP